MPQCTLYCKIRMKQYGRCRQMVDLSEHRPSKCIASEKRLKGGFVS